MPVEFAAYAVQKTTWLQLLLTRRVISSVLLCLLIILLYRFFQGRKNIYTQNMHGRVIIMTGATSGIGAAVARNLADQGAQLILLVRSVEDGWTQEYVTDLRESSGNQLIYAEECDLSDLLSIRRFATKWIDNSPPRRLDQVLLCAGITQPPFAQRVTTKDGIEVQFGVNYLANFHLLSILSPALRAQPGERDVRVIALTCTSYILGAVQLKDIDFLGRGYPVNKPWQAFGASKIYLMAMIKALQKKIDASPRADKMPSRVKCLLVDPGLSRTASFRRFISCGSIMGLFGYLLTYPFWYIFIKSTQAAAQAVLYASMAPVSHEGEDGIIGGSIIAECRTKPARRDEVDNETFQADLWKLSESMIHDLEPRSAKAKKGA